MKIRNAIAVLAMVALVLGCIGSTPEPTAMENTSDTAAQIATGELDQDFDEYLQRYKQRRLFKETATKPDRSVYGVSMRVFEELPEFPDDFLFKVYLIKVGKFFDLASLGPEYWMQPEFDPEFTRQGLRYWSNWNDPNFRKSHWSTMGVRSYPYNQYVTAVPGDSFNVTLFLSTDWNVETFQGVSVKTRWIDTATTQEGGVMTAMPNAGDFIDVNVTPDEFLLSPSFPQFTEDWIKKLTFSGKIDENTPKGMYILTMDLGTPSQERSDEWFLEYLNLYSEGVQMIKLDKPYLQAFINVQDAEPAA